LWLSLWWLSETASMAGALRFCARALEADVGFTDAFLAPAARIRGALLSARAPSDLQRHDVGPRGEVVHLSALGVGAAGPVGASAAEAAAAEEAAIRIRRRRVRRAGRLQEEAIGTNAESRGSWTAALYARGRWPPAARRLLADALQVHPGALRASQALHLPGVAVEMVTLRRGLPIKTLREPGDALHTGLIMNQQPVVAVGAAGMATALAPPLTRSTAKGPAQRREEREAWHCKGHRYSVVVRGLDVRQCDMGLVDDSMDRLQEHGFLNLFELSSFGLTDIRRYEVGAALWGGRWDHAARLLLSMNWGGGSSPSGAASAVFRNGNLERGLDLLPESGAEGLRILATQLLHGRPALEALHDCVPARVWERNLSALAKLAWNKAAAARFAGGSGLPRRPVAGELIWDESAGKARPLLAKEAPDFSLADLLLPVPRLREALPSCVGRLQMEATLRRFVPGEEAPIAAFPRGVGTRLLPLRRLVCLPTDVSWDVLRDEGAAADAVTPAPLVECDLARLGVDLAPAKVGGGCRGGGGGRRSTRAAAARGGLALRARFSLPQGSFVEAALREMLHANPSEFVEGLGRRDELF